MSSPNETLPAGVALLAASSMLCPARGAGAAVPLRPSTLRTLTSLVHSLRTEIPLETPLADPSSFLHPFLKSPHITTDIVAAMRSSWLSQAVHREETFAPNLYLLPVDDPAEYEEMTLHFDAYTMTGAFFLNRYDAIGNIYEYLEKFFPKALGNASPFGVAPSLLLGQQWAEAPTTTTVPSAKGTSAHRHPCDQRLVSRQTLDTFRSGRQLRFPEFLSLVADCTMSYSDVEFHSAQLACRIVNTAHVELDELRSRARMALYRHNEHREPRGLRERMDVAVRSLDAEIFSTTSTTTFPKMLQMLVKDDGLLEELGLRLEVPTPLPHYQLQSLGGGGGGGGAPPAVAASRRNRLALVLFLILESFPIVAFASRRHVGVVEDYLSERSKRRSDRPATMFEEYGDAFAAAVVKFAPLVFPVELKQGAVDVAPPVVVNHRQRAGEVQPPPTTPVQPSSPRAAPVLSPRRSDNITATATSGANTIDRLNGPQPSHPATQRDAAASSVFRSPPRAAASSAGPSAHQTGAPVPLRTSMEVGGEVIVVSPYRPRHQASNPTTRPQGDAHRDATAAAPQRLAHSDRGSAGDALHWWPSSSSSSSPSYGGSGAVATAGVAAAHERPREHQSSGRSPLVRHDEYGLDALRREFDQLMTSDPLTHEGPRGTAASSAAAPQQRAVDPPRQSLSPPRQCSNGRRHHLQESDRPLTLAALQQPPAAVHRSPKRNTPSRLQPHGVASPTTGRRDPRLHPAPLREAKDQHHSYGAVVPATVGSPLESRAAEATGTRPNHEAAPQRDAATAAAAQQRHNDWMRLIQSEAAEIRHQQRHPSRQDASGARTHGDGAASRGAIERRSDGSPPAMVHHPTRSPLRGHASNGVATTASATRMVRLDPMSPMLSSSTAQPVGIYQHAERQTPEHQQQQQYMHHQRHPVEGTRSTATTSMAAGNRHDPVPQHVALQNIHVVLPAGGSGAPQHSDAQSLYVPQRLDYSSSRHKRLEQRQRDETDTYRGSTTTATLRDDVVGGRSYANMHVVVPFSAAGTTAQHRGVFRDTTNQAADPGITSHRKLSRHEELLELEALIEREKAGGARRGGSR